MCWSKLQPTVPYMCKSLYFLMYKTIIAEVNIKDYGYVTGYAVFYLIKMHLYDSHINIYL